MGNETAAIAMGFGIAAIMLSGIAILISATVWARMVGVEKSTHQVQFVPMETPDGKPLEGEELDKNMKDALGSEGTEQEYI